MTRIITWYDVLGVLPDAPAEDIRQAWQARQDALQPAMLAGAPPSVTAAADRARQAADNACRILADPAAREAYDVQIGFERPGEGLASPSWAPSDPALNLSEGWSTADQEASDPYPSRHSRVVVPDVAGLFYQACLDVTGRVGLQLDPVRLTAHPMPVEGLVVGQTPPPGQQVRYDSTVTVQLWHPPEPGR
jgi:PASTA domain